MAVKISKSNTASLAEVVPIRSDYPQLEDAIRSHADRIQRESQALVPMCSVFGPTVMMDSGLTVTTQQRHNHGLPPAKMAEVRSLPEKAQAEKKAAGVEETEDVKSADTPINDVPSKHRLAAKIQKVKSHLGVIVWYGEHTGEFWVLDFYGLHSFPTISEMYKGMGW